MLQPLAIHCKVVEENLHERWDILVENLGDDPLQRGRCCLRSEHHYLGHEDTPFRDKHRFLLIVQVHSDLVIAVEPV